PPGRAKVTSRSTSLVSVASSRATEPNNASDLTPNCWRSSSQWSARIFNTLSRCMHDPLLSRSLYRAHLSSARKIKDAYEKRHKAAPENRVVDDLWAPHYNVIHSGAAEMCCRQQVSMRAMSDRARGHSSSCTTS